jgi:hypothetical protein
LQKKTLLAAAVLVLVVGASLSAFSLYQGSGYSGALAKASNYLARSYNPKLGLFSQTPGGSTYFVYPDSFLAAEALASSGNSTLKKIAVNATYTDNVYLAHLKSPQSQYEVMTSTKGAFFAPSNYVLATVGGATIEVTLNNGTMPVSPASHADLAFLEALYFARVLPHPEAVGSFELGLRLFDGYGLRDAAYAGTYQTYKLALMDYVGKVLGFQAPGGLEANLTKMQAPNGGFYEGYTDRFSSNGTATNTATTSLAMLALSEAAPARGILGYSFLPLFVAAVIAVVLLEAAALKRRSEKEKELGIQIEVL